MPRIQRGLPTATVLTGENTPRADEPAVFPDREAILRLSPEREFDFVKVKKVIE